MVRVLDARHGMSENLDHNAISSSVDLANIAFPTHKDCVVRSKPFAIAKLSASDELQPKG